jgi:hypothetical protein
MHEMYQQIMDSIEPTKLPIRNVNDSIVRAAADELKRLFSEGDSWMKARVVKAVFLNSTLTSGTLYSCAFQPFEFMKPASEAGLAALTGFEPVSPP